MSNFKCVWGVLCLALVCAVLAGCAGTTSPTLHQKADATTYRIGPGDTLQIYVRNNADLSMQVPVRPDGKISMPLVQTIVAANKTPDELAGDLTQALSEYVRDPVVTVIVTQFQGTYADQVRVVGEAAQPRSMPYREGMTLLDVMINVGGLTQFAAGNRAKLVRQQSNGQTQSYSVDLEDLLNGNIKDNVPMHPGDVVIIPRTYF
ncbi:XrtA/PEP-CTERM system exopolysaccharide export protein [Salinisphaera sp. Q1T1-3]|uniref:XrtA/PEP-CTERM system exopolysaccharide export protein n=1 Tax=Salinisphaera sp. Q1T1-3 TaxID=2321229 RepID=UPI000E753A72|nr:XrtA/PEP-CTERM system exopolysaccharide export protein [Salinisphaera sp. Q1T1-3]RJS94714.1 sugar ABC transporter substrate-binding protein [Salinisphaera sp. Q1T1-3]